MNRKSLVYALAGLGLALGSALGLSGRVPPALAADKPVLKIGYLPITHSLPVAVADALYSAKYKNFKLEPVKFSSWPELVEAYSSGKIQAASELLVLALAAAERGVPEKIVALSHRHGDILTVAPEIGSVKDLKGKRVAIPHRMSVHNILLHLALQKEGLKLADVEWVEMPPPDMPAALARGDIKGYIVAEPFGAKAVLGGYGKKLVDGRQIWADYICCGLVVSPSFAAAHPEAVKEFVQSFVAAGQYIEKNREEAIRIAKKYMAIDEATWRKSFEWGVSYGDLRPVRSELEALQKHALELKLLKAPQKLDALVDASLVQGAYKSK
ncbi:MAG: ABC transporter substrate-binding protein [Deltaproteobacteria bacterium]|nr:ABC transporter substrate-binding protein [Deltaproteobacteria bacterium]